jgi:hypothetical protein
LSGNPDMPPRPQTPKVTFFSNILCHLHLPAFA